MTKLVIWNGKDYVVYDLDKIKKIQHDKAINLYSKSDIYGNDMKPQDSLMVIHFFEGTTATFSSDYKIYFK